MNDHSSRWLGLRSYEERDAKLFFGREIESEQISRMVVRETLTTIFAPSGTGKTSLLRAGVFPRLREKAFFPIWLRLDHSVSGTNHSKWLRSQIEEAAKEEGLEITGIVPAQSTEDQETLWEFLHRIELWDKDNQLITPVIVLDQFEEIFTAGKGRPESDELLETLADIVEKRIPKSLNEDLSKKGKRNIIPTDIQGFRVVLSLREDFVAHLESMRRRMPSIIHNRYYLQSLNGNKALQIILKAGKDIVEESVARKIVEIVANADKNNEIKKNNFTKLTVEPTLLSLVCHELDRQRIREELDHISPKDLENASTDILQKFYDKSFEGLDKEARTFVEDKLLTKTGFRKSQPIDDARASGLSGQAQTQLINRHILRKIDRKDMPRIELTHDLLTEIVMKSRDIRHEHEKNIRLEKIREKQRKKKRTLIGATFTFFFLFLLASWFSYKYYQEANNSKIAARDAEQAQKKTMAMLNFMTDDLYNRLLSIGRLDLLEEIALKADKEFIKDKNNNEISSELKSQVLNKIANVLARKGNVYDAITAYQESQELLDIHKKI